MNNVKQPSFCQIRKCCEFFSACLFRACDLELVLRASLPSQACGAVCHTRVEHVTLLRDKLCTRLWKVPFARLWAWSLFRRAGKKRKPVFSHIFRCCAMWTAVPRVILPRLPEQCTEHAYLLHKCLSFSLSPSLSLSSFLERLGLPSSLECALFMQNEPRVVSLFHLVHTTNCIGNREVLADFSE